MVLILENSSELWLAIQRWLAPVFLALRAELSDDEVADVIWSMNAAEYYVLLVQAWGWTPERFGEWLVDAWCRLLLAKP